MRALGVSAIGTGEGKTLVALGLARALARAGYTVAPFKSGPDYLDAQLYVHACGVRARNLDLWLDGSDRVGRELERARDRGAVTIIEGMMGFFDGDDTGETSTAHILSSNDVPAVIVVDGWRMSQSAAAVALGCAAAQPRVQIAGVILNRCAGESHARAVRRACEHAGIPLLATIPYDAAFTMPERHLGIDVSALEGLPAALDRLATILCEQLDVRAVFGEPVPRIAESVGAVSGPIIAYADDDALSFTYPQTLDALATIGRPVRFSPLDDRALPDGTAALWLGGGYPEMYASRLSQNDAMLRALADAADSGIPIYAECGGMMVLGRSIETKKGRFSMAGVLDLDVSIAQPALVIGYRNARAASANIFDGAGEEFRGYEFHYASAVYREQAAYHGAKDPGARRGKILASFVHRRFHPGDRTLWRFAESFSS